MQRIHCGGELRRLFTKQGATQIAYSFPQIPNRQINNKTTPYLSADHAHVLLHRVGRRLVTDDCVGQSGVERPALQVQRHEPREHNRLRRLHLLFHDVVKLLRCRAASGVEYPAVDSLPRREEQTQSKWHFSMSLQISSIRGHNNRGHNWAYIDMSSVVSDGSMSLALACTSQEGTTDLCLWLCHAKFGACPPSCTAVARVSSTPGTENS